MILRRFQAIIGYIFQREDIDRNRIVVYGNSFGGGAAIDGVSFFFGKDKVGTAICEQKDNS